MGILEAIVVVYLRRIYYPDGFGFPLVLIEPEILRAELVREAMTLIMLATVAWIAAERAWPRLVAFLVAFGVWDIVYYMGLKLFLGWPGSLIEPDVLFLIPSVWIGPVLAPTLVAATWVVAGLLVHRARYADIALGWKGWVTGALSFAVILASFVINVGTPENPGFHWWLYGIGYALMLVAIAPIVVRARRVRKRR